MAYVYCLATTSAPLRTYIGATIDLNRRLAQHNGQRAGGARRTRARPGEWYRVCYVRGFTSWQAALQFEWRWKWFSRAPAQKAAGGGPLELRQRALDATLAWWKEQKGGQLEVLGGEECDITEANAPTDSEYKPS